MEKKWKNSKVKETPARSKDGEHPRDHLATMATIQNIFVLSLENVNLQLFRFQWDSAVAELMFYKQEVVESHHLSICLELITAL